MKTVWVVLDSNQYDWGFRSVWSTKEGAEQEVKSFNSLPGNSWAHTYIMKEVELDDPNPRLEE